MAGIVKQMSAPQAQELALQFITSIREQKKKQSYIRYYALGKGLAELATKLSEEQANELTQQLITEVKASENRMQTMAFGSGLAIAAANIPVLQIVTKAKLIMANLKARMTHN